MEYTAEQKAREEGWKLHYDVFKHLTTLCTGSILILVSFLEKLFANPQWKGLVGIAFFLFVVSMFGSIITMIRVASLIRDFGKRDDSLAAVEGIAVFMAYGAFLGGITCLIVFAMKNLYR